MPLFFVAGQDLHLPGADKVLLAEGAELAKHIHYLGAGGVRSIAGLRVAFASGLAEPPFVNEMDQTPPDLEAAAKPSPESTESAKTQQDDDPEPDTDHVSPEQAPTATEPFVPTLTPAVVTGVLRALSTAAPAFQTPSQSQPSSSSASSPSTSRLVDVLLTAEWPRGFHHRLVHSSLPALPRKLADSELVEAAEAAGSDSEAVRTLSAAAVAGSAAAAAIARAASPRYHFASGLPVSFARQPYVNSSDSASLIGGIAPSTRFVALAQVPAADSAASSAASGEDAATAAGTSTAAASAIKPKPPKWIHALNLLPASRSPAGDALLAAPPGASLSPFLATPLALYAPQAASVHAAEQTASYTSHAAAAAPAQAAEPSGFMARLLGNAQAEAASASAASAAAAKPRVAARRAEMEAAAAEIEAAGADMAGAGAAAVRGRQGGAVFFGRATDGRGQGKRRRERDGDASASGGPSGQQLVGDEDGGLASSAPGSKTREPITEQRTDCWFCPASPEFAQHLIVSLATDAYVTLPKGPVDEHHVLLVSMSHSPSMAAAPPQVLADLARYKSALRQWYAAKGLAMLLFERAVRTRGSAHAHLQAFGVPPAQAAMALETFRKEGRDSGIAFAVMTGPQDGKEASLERLSGGDQYFYAELPAVTGTDPLGSGGGYEPVRLFHKVPKSGGHPLQFGRKAVCAILQCPDRLRWNACAQTDEVEAAAGDAARASFGPFDFSLAN